MKENIFVQSYKAIFDFISGHMGVELIYEGLANQSIAPEGSLFDDPYHSLFEGDSDAQ